MFSELLRKPLYQILADMLCLRTNTAGIQRKIPIVSVESGIHQEVL